MGSGGRRTARRRGRAAGVDDEEADDFVSEPVEVDDEDEPESDDFEVDEAGVLLDEEPRLSFR